MLFVFIWCSISNEMAERLGGRTETQQINPFFYQQILPIACTQKIEDEGRTFDASSEEPTPILVNANAHAKILKTNLCIEIHNQE